MGTRGWVSRLRVLLLLFQATYLGSGKKKQGIWKQSWVSQYATKQYYFYFFMQLAAASAELDGFFENRSWASRLLSYLFFIGMF
jgi:hypothetical protein